MPVYKVDLMKAVNLTKLESYRSALAAAKQAWRRDLLHREAQALTENADGITLNLDYKATSVYLVVSRVGSSIRFESLYPIIPDFFWESPDGQTLRAEIATCLHRFFRRSVVQFEAPLAKCEWTTGSLEQTIDFDQVYATKALRPRDPGRFQDYGNKFDAKVVSRIEEIVAQLYKAEAERKPKGAAKPEGTPIQGPPAEAQKMFALAADQQSFIHLTRHTRQQKFRAEEHSALRGEAVEEIYEGEDIVYFETEVCVGTLQVQSSCHGLVDFEERHPFRRMHHFLTYISNLLGQELPLANPYDPEMQLVQLEN